MKKVNVLISKTFCIPEKPSNSELKEYKLFTNHEEEILEITKCQNDGEYRKCGYIPCELCVYNFYGEKK